MADDDFVLEYGERLSEDDLQAYFWQSLEAAREWFDPIWEEFGSLSDAYGGDTLSDADRTWLVDTKRVPISFNIFASTVDAIVGSDMADRKEVVFRGTDLGYFDGVIGEWMTMVLRHQMAKCRGHRAQSDAFHDMLIGGYGFTEIYLDTSKVPAPVVQKKVQPWEMYPDPDATEDNLTDARFFIRVRRWPVEEVQARWPEKAAEIEAGITTGDLPTTTPKPHVAGVWTERASPTKRRMVTVYDFPYCRYEPRVLTEDPETQEPKLQRLEEFEEEQAPGKAAYEAAMEMWEATGGPTLGTPPPEPAEFYVTEHTTISAKVWYRAYLMGDGADGAGIVLEHKEAKPQGDQAAPYKVLTGYKKKMVEDRRVRFFGPAKKIFDAQLYLNKSAQVYLDILARGAKGGGFINKDIAGSDPAKLIKETSIPGMWHVVDGPLGPENIQFKPTQSTPTGYENFLSLCIDMMSRISLVTDWVKGTAQQERSNVLISNLQQQSMTALNPLFDPLAQFRELVGLYMMKLALEFLPDRVINRIVGEFDPVVGLTHEEVPNPETGQVELQPIPSGRTGEPTAPADILRMVDPFEYDVEVDTGQASANQKQAVWQIFVQTGLLQQLVEVLGPAMQSLIPQLIRYLPLPASMAKTMADDLEAQMEQQKAIQTEEGLVDALSQMPPEQQLAMLERAASMTQGGGAAPPMIQ